MKSTMFVFLLALCLSLLSPCIHAELAPFYRLDSGDKPNTKILSNQEQQKQRQIDSDGTQRRNLVVELLERQQQQSTSDQHQESTSFAVGQDSSRLPERQSYYTRTLIESPLGRTRSVGDGYSKYVTEHSPSKAPTKKVGHYPTKKEEEHYPTKKEEEHYPTKKEEDVPDYSYDNVKPETHPPVPVSEDYEYEYHYSKDGDDGDDDDGKGTYEHDNSGGDDDDDDDDDDGKYEHHHSGGDDDDGGKGKGKGSSSSKSCKSTKSSKSSKSCKYDESHPSKPKPSPKPTLPPAKYPTQAPYPTATPGKKKYIRFVMVREESGTPVPGYFGIGDSLALNGQIYYWEGTGDKYVSDVPSGNFVALCTGVSSKDELLCTYEIVLRVAKADETSAGVGVLVASGPNYYEENDMIVTGTEFDFAKYKGGTLVTVEDPVKPYLYATLYLI